MKVVPINFKSFLSGYSAAQENHLVPDDAVFLAGVALTMILPVIAYCHTNGPIPAVVFAGVALTGAIMGWVGYRLIPNEVVTRLSVGNVPRTPKAATVRLKMVS